MTEQEIIDLEELFPYKAADAFRKARQKTLDAGLSILEKDGDSLFEVFPDGKKILIKKYETN